MAGNFGRKIFWGIDENISLAKFTLAVEPVISNNYDIHNKMANRMRWEFNRAVS